MSIRDEELKRITKYAQGLGITIVYSPYTKGCSGADWDYESKSITVYGKERLSKTTIILYFLHEIGHHLDWIYNDKIVTPEVDAAYTALNTKHEASIPKKQRKLILTDEMAAIAFMEVIYKELDLKIPYWKVKREQLLDQYHYELFYNEARFPTTLEYKNKRKVLTEECKRLYS